MLRIRAYCFAALLGLLLWAGASRLQAQQAEVIHLPQLLAYDTLSNDTLYVLNFWATWCRPCVAEMPHFDKLQRELEAQKVKVIFVSMDFMSDYETRLLPFLKKRKPYAQVVLLDEPKYNEWMDKVSTKWSGAIPATLFVQHSRGIRHFHEGDFTYESLHSQVMQLLNQ